MKSDNPALPRTLRNTASGLLYLSHHEKRLFLDPRDGELSKRVLYDSVRMPAHGARCDRSGRRQYWGGPAAT